jgi:hypothetical protein
VLHDDEPVGLDGLRVEFDDERAVSDAGVMLVATLAKRLEIEAQARRLVRLPRDRPGAANAGRKVMALLFAMVLGADSIDDCDALRAGRTRQLLGGWVPAPSTSGDFCARSRSGMCAGSMRCVGSRWCAPGGRGWPWHDDYIAALVRIRALSAA